MEERHKRGAKAKDRDQVLDGSEELLQENVHEGQDTVHIALGNRDPSLAGKRIDKLREVKPQALDRGKELIAGSVLCDVAAVGLRNGGVC